MGQILNIEQAASKTGLPVSTLRYWRLRGEGPPSFKLGKRVAYDEANLDAWIQEQAHLQTGA